ncbi:MAG: hypothetical protein IJP98_00655 [Clostridia bacterium]|nr:hypothetical protein [Clostridia bacterium]
MKKVWILMLASLLLVCAVACKTQTAEQPDDAEEANDTPTALVGGWTVSDSAEVTEAQKALLDKALTGLVGATYEPIAYLGSQLVAGTNHCLLCKVTPVVPEPESHYALVFLYEDFSGNVQLMNVADVSLVPGAEADGEPLAGGWRFTDDPAVTPELKEVFDLALNGLVGTTYTPIAHLGTQVVAGTNHCFLCRCEAVSPEAAAYYTLMTVYQDLNGNAELLEVNLFDYASYCTYGA